MKEVTIREGREGLSHPKIRFTDDEEILIVRRGEPVARILPVNPKRNVRSIKAFLVSQPMQTVPSEDLLMIEREDRC